VGFTFKDAEYCVKRYLPQIQAGAGIPFLASCVVLPLEVEVDCFRLRYYSDQLPPILAKEVEFRFIESCTCRRRLNDVFVLPPRRDDEVQGMGEHGTFARPELDRLLGLAEAGIRQLFDAQRQVLGW
jgi:hypothetical protein